MRGRRTKGATASAGTTVAVLARWDDHVWDESISANVKLALIDFRNILGVINMDTCKDGEPYFEDFLTTLKVMEEPKIFEPVVWLWICVDKDVELDLRQKIETSAFGEQYTVHYAEYIPAPFERLGAGHLHYRGFAHAIST